MKNIYIIPILFFSGLTFAQTGKIGIGTSAPNKNLHVKGNVQFTKDLKVGGTVSTAGNPGTEGQVLVSQGNNKPPKWVNLKTMESLPHIASMSEQRKNQNVAHQYNSGAETQVFFLASEVSKLDNDYITYNATTGEFTVKKNGIYRIYVRATYDTELNPHGFTAGHAKTTIFKNNTRIFARSSYHGERTPRVNHTFTGADKFQVGDKITMKTYREQNHIMTLTGMVITFNGTGT